MAENDQQSAADKVNARRNLRLELDLLATALEELKTEYELYFSGIRIQEPVKLHDEVKRQIRDLNGAPFKSSELTFRLRTLRNRYQSYHTYISRVMREKEEGTYIRDQFKVDLRERQRLQREHAASRAGQAEAQMVELFQTYRRALQEQTTSSVEIDFRQFQQMVTARAQELGNGRKRVRFSIIEENGQVKLEARTSGDS